MYVEELSLRSSAGLPHPLKLEGLRPGLVLLVGPNASGKSTLGRLLRGTLWPAQAPADMDAQTRWRLQPGGPRRNATLVFGRTQWDGEAPQIHGESAASWQLTLRELLATDGASDHAIAAAIQRQLDGGYDISALEKTRGPATRPPTKLRRAWQDTSEALRAALEKTDSLQAAEQRLTTLRAQVTSAVTAHGQLVHVQEAMQRLDLQQRYVELQRELGTLPTDISSLPEDAEGTAERLISRANQAEAEARQAADDLRVAGVNVASLAFPGGDPGSAQLDDWQHDAEHIVQTAGEVRRLREHETTAQARADTLAQQVWLETHGADLPDPNVLTHLAEIAHQVGVTDAFRAGLESLADALGEPSAQEEGDLRREPLLEARRVLLAWLALPTERAPQRHDAPNTSLAVLLLAAGLCLGAMGAGVAVAGSWPVGAPMIGVGLGCVGLGAGRWWGLSVAHHGMVQANREAAAAVLNSTRETQERLLERYDQAGVAAPQSWSNEGVEHHLHELERLLLVANHDEVVQRQHAHLDRQRSRHEAAALAQRCELDTATAAHGLAEDLPGLALHLQGDRILNLANARAELADATATRQQLALDLNTASNQLRRGLSALQSDDLGPLISASALLRASRQVSQRHSDWCEAVKMETRERSRLEKVTDALRAANVERDAYLTRCGVTLETVGQLPKLAQQRSSWQDLTRDADVIERQLNTLNSRLPEELPKTRAALETTRALLQAEIDGQAEVQRQVSTIEHQLEVATRSTTVAEALRDRAEAHDALVQARDDAHADHVMHGLIAWLRSQRSPQQTPAILRRARAWFRQFTQNRYELKVSGDGRFVALDLRSQRTQALSELSSGTRVQLLLAARIAYVEHSEQGGHPLPLFLDEVLSTTDPERFAAIATAVLQLAQCGDTGAPMADDAGAEAAGSGSPRQVFYATADPSEVQRWIQHAKQSGLPLPQVFNLDASRVLPAWTDQPQLAPVSAQQAPRRRPTGTDPIEHMTALGLRRPTLHDDAASWPLALLLQTDLEAAWEAAMGGVTTAGQLRWHDDGVPLPLGDALVAKARARLRLVEVTVQMLRVGRGKPVTWAAVETSEAVSATFRERVREVLVSHGQNPEDFLAAVTQIPRFRRESVARLRGHLEERGMVDSTAVLSVEDVVERVTVGCVPALTAGHIGLVDVPRWVTFIAAVVRVS